MSVDDPSKSIVTTTEAAQSVIKDTGNVLVDSDLALLKKYPVQIQELDPMTRHLLEK